MNLIIFNCKIFIDTKKPYHIKYLHDKKIPRSLLETLEIHNIPINYQCRSGYCGSCRANLQFGIVQYYIQPLASFFSSTEILTCCCYPITHITLKI
ncbi:ferredoxin [Candidatus Blochmanniella floridana]|uniref:Ferredoxin n=1 Tax=Blochmanniella floridana TaxID=203907 RepID=Q7VRW5_BLOFL|nr:ferredoxin [Candidatus Blochmannia floridanus]